MVDRLYCCKYSVVIFPDRQSNQAKIIFHVEVYLYWRGISANSVLRNSRGIKRLTFQTTWFLWTVCSITFPYFEGIERQQNLTPSFQRVWWPKIYHFYGVSMLTKWQNLTRARCSFFLECCSLSNNKGSTARKAINLVLIFWKSINIHWEQYSHKYRKHNFIQRFSLVLTTIRKINKIQYWHKKVKIEAIRGTLRNRDHYVLNSSKEIK